MRQCQCVVTLLLLATLIHADEVEATIEMGSTTIRLSETTTATLTIIGPEPLLVTVPPDPLSDASQAIWQVTTLGSTTTTKLPDGRERWQLTYRVEPFAPGEAVSLQFQSVNVDNRSIELPAVTMIVTTDAEASIANLRPWTDIEAAPPLPPATSSHRQWWWLLLLGLVPLALLLRRSDRPLSIMVQLRQRHGQLEHDATTMTIEHFAEKIHRIVCDYLAESAAIPTDRLTTQERIQAIEVSHQFDAETRTQLQAVFLQCEELRFARMPRTDNRLSLLESVKTILDSQTVGTAPRP